MALDSGWRALLDSGTVFNGPFSIPGSLGGSWDTLNQERLTHRQDPYMGSGGTRSQTYGWHLYNRSPL